MSLIFAGKLLASKSVQDDHDKESPTFGIRHLSRREKQLLDELGRTRTEIVRELVMMGPSVPGADIELWQKTISDYRTTLQPEVPHTGSRKNRRAKEYDPKRAGVASRRSQYGQRTMANTCSPQKMKSSLDALPILSCSGDFSNRKTEKIQTIQLPVVSLPLIGRSSTPQNRISLNTIQSPDECNEESPTTPMSSIDMTCSTLFANMSEGLGYIQSYFGVSDDTMKDIKLHADAVLAYVDSESTGSSTSKELATVFLAVRYRHTSCSIDGTSTRDGAGGEMLPSIQNGQSRRVDSGGGRLVSSRSLSGTSMRLGDSLYDSRALSPCHDSYTQSQSRSKIKATGSSSFRATASNTRKSRVAWPVQEEMSREESLRNDLMSSIGNMHRHTAEVKKSILGVQDLVALTNPKARSFVKSIAADHLCMSLTRLGQRELKRGWDAWILCIRNQSLRENSILIRRFVRLRKICVLLATLVHRIVRGTFLHWVKFSVAERLRVEMEIKRAASVQIQRIARGVIGRNKARQAAEGHKYLQMHKSLVKLQALFRCKLQQWKYQKYMRQSLEERSCELIQRVVRGFIHRRRVRKIRMYKDKESAAVTIQAAARGMRGRKRANGVKLLRLKNKVIVKIQALARGYIGRNRVGKILQDKVEAAAAIKIQARIRGAVTRVNLHHRRREVEEYRSERSRMVTIIQAAYRGYRARVMVRYYLDEHNKHLAHQHCCAVKIQCMIRMFLARSRVLKLTSDRMELMISNACTWKEMWAEDSASWFYLNELTQEALWEPPSEGYTKNDGQLVLANGKIVDKPDRSGKKKRAPGDEHLCVECAQRVAIRSCNECGDNFCTKCYKETHASGSRKQHTFTPTGPIDCAECEEHLAERWCVSCDEAFCDSCWRKVHSKGKRRYHPFSQVLEDGHVDSRIFTIDGEQVQSYDASYSQNRYEEDNTAAIQSELEWDQSAYEDYEVGENIETSADEAYDDGYSQSVDVSYEDEAAEWVQYYDENEYPYWYNSTTGESTYDNPYSP